MIEIDGSIIKCTVFEERCALHSGILMMYVAQQC